MEKQSKLNPKDQAAGEHTTECEKRPQHTVATSLELEHGTEIGKGAHCQQEPAAQSTHLQNKGKLGQRKILIASTVAGLVQNRNINVENLTKGQLARAMKAEGFTCDDWDDEPLQKSIRDKVRNGKVLTSLIAKTAVSLARNSRDIKDHIGSLSIAMQDHGFPQSGINNQQLRNNILIIAKDCFIAQKTGKSTTNHVST